MSVHEVERAAFFAGNRVYLLASDAANAFPPDSPDREKFGAIMAAAAALTDRGIAAMAVRIEDE